MRGFGSPWPFFLCAPIGETSQLVSRGPRLAVSTQPELLTVIKPLGKMVCPECKALKRRRHPFVVGMKALTLPTRPGNKSLTFWSLYEWTKRGRPKGEKKVELIYPGSACGSNVSSKLDPHSKKKSGTLQKEARRRFWAKPPKIERLYQDLFNGWHPNGSVLGIFLPAIGGSWCCKWENQRSCSLQAIPMLNQSQLQTCHLGSKCSAPWIYHPNCNAGKNEQRNN